MNLITLCNIRVLKLSNTLVTVPTGQIATSRDLPQTPLQIYAVPSLREKPLVLLRDRKTRRWSSLGSNYNPETLSKNEWPSEKLRIQDSNVHFFFACLCVHCAWYVNITQSRNSSRQFKSGSVPRDESGRITFHNIIFCQVGPSSRETCCCCYKAVLLEVKQRKNMVLSTYLHLCNTDLSFVICVLQRKKSWIFVSLEARCQLKEMTTLFSRVRFYLDIKNEMEVTKSKYDRCLLSVKFHQSANTQTSNCYAVTRRYAWMCPTNVLESNMSNRWYLPAYEPRFFLAGEL